MTGHIYGKAIILDISSGQICQSCAMPLQKTEDFGTEAEGARSEEYCRFCYREGKFTDPDITLEGQIEKLVKLAGKEMGIEEEMARAMANEIIPRLKRWSS
jgi:hypothetical protein